MLLMQPTAEIYSGHVPAVQWGRVNKRVGVQPNQTTSHWCEVTHTNPRFDPREYLIVSRYWCQKTWTSVWTLHTCATPLLSCAAAPPFASAVLVPRAGWCQGEAASVENHV